jgi:hypothetical protein
MSANPLPPEQDDWATDDLAGIPVLIDGPGDTTRRPRRPLKNGPDLKTPPHDPNAKPPEDDSRGKPGIGGDEPPAANG